MTVTKMTKHTITHLNSSIQDSIDTALKEHFLPEEALAIRWGTSKKLLQKMRYSGGGVPFIKLGASVRYALSDVVAYENSRKQQNTCR